jgi:serine/threonine protein kinase
VSQQYTEAYAAPEQMERRACSTAVDAFSAGKVLFELLSGEDSTLDDGKLGKERQVRSQLNHLPTWSGPGSLFDRETTSVECRTGWGVRNWRITRRFFLASTSSRPCGVRPILRRVGPKAWGPQRGGLEPEFSPQ